MVDIIEKAVKEIKELKIQGATNVAKAALGALAEDMKMLGYKDSRTLKEQVEKLAQARPTEPLTQNCLGYVLWQTENGWESTQAIDLILAKLEEVKREIVKNGVSLLENGMVILTHCHSSTVEEILKSAHRLGLRFKVYLTETRPRFQGRLTAEHLTKEGLALTMITDAEAAFLVSREDQKEINLVLLGSDALSVKGDAVNKVGSYGIALASQKARVPLYLATTLLKVSPKKIILEERDPEEIWKKPPKGVAIFNPAFDLVPKELITGFITEFGIVKPEKIKGLVRKNYPWIIENAKRKTQSAKLKKETPYLAYLHLREKVDPKKHILATFKLEAKDFLTVAGGVAAESSVGTWTKVATQLENVWERLHARVLAADKKTGFLKIAYPLDLFEPGNIPQLLSSVAGNIFGLKEVGHLKLLDLQMPEVYVQGFPGPQIGAQGIREIAGVFDRPLIGSIIKPKLGLNFRQNSQVAQDVFEGGVDFVKDDENLTSQKFNPFRQRVLEIMRYFKKAGLANKIYAFNITAEAELMKERAGFVRKNGGNCFMVDILTVGFSGFQFLRNQNYGLIIHGHRAGHAALTRDPKEGISMLVLAKLSRLAGVDSLHTGTVVGKMAGGKEEVVTVNQFLREEWFGLKPVMPVASGGLHPALVPDLVKILGKDCLFNFGGGIHGHPQGSKAGARAVFQALEAVGKGKTLTAYAQNHPELNEALRHWRQDG